MLLSQVAVKLVPLDRAEMESFAWPLPLTMMILTGLKLPIDEPFAFTLLNVVLLKCASGSGPPLEVQQGASTIASAELFAAPDS